MIKYLNVKGTAGRSEFWGVTLISLVLLTISMFIGNMLISTDELTGLIFGTSIMLIALVLYSWCFVVVAIKRCRDAGINPWWTAASFLPYIGLIPWIVFGCLPTDKKDE